MLFKQVSNIDANLPKTTIKMRLARLQDYLHYSNLLIPKALGKSFYAGQLKRTFIKKTLITI